MCVHTHTHTHTQTHTQNMQALYYVLYVQIQNMIIFPWISCVLK